MTTPSRAVQRYSERVYQVVDPATGEPRDVPGASSLTKVLASPGLERWKLRQVAEACLVHGVRDVDKAVQSIYGSSSAAATGTEIHAAIEASIDGKPYDSLLESYVASWRRLCDEHRLIVHLSERTVAHGPIGYAGTLDHLVEHDGTLKILDVKTGSGVYPEVAVQLAALAYAEGWLEADGSITPFEFPIDTETALVAHIPAKSVASALVPVRLDRAWPAVEALVNLWRWNKNNNRDVGDPIESIYTERRRQLRIRAQRLPKDLLDELKKGWPVPGLRFGDPAGWTDEALDAVDGALVPLELAAWDRLSDEEKQQRTEMGKLPAPRRAPLERIRDLADRGKSLHASTRKKLDAMAVEAGLPNFGLPSRWTVEQADLVETWIVAEEEAAAARAAKRAEKEAAVAS